MSFFAHFILRSCKTCRVVFKVCFLRLSVSKHFLPRSRNLWIRRNLYKLFSSTQGRGTKMTFYRTNVHFSSFAYSMRDFAILSITSSKIGPFLCSINWKLLNGNIFSVGSWLILTVDTETPPQSLEAETKKQWPAANFESKIKGKTHLNVILTYIGSNIKLRSITPISLRILHLFDLNSVFSPRLVRCFGVSSLLFCSLVGFPSLSLLFFSSLLCFASFFLSFTCFFTSLACAILKKRLVKRVLR